MKKGPKKLSTRDAKLKVLEAYASGEHTLEAACRAVGYSRSSHAYWVGKDAGYADNFCRAKEVRVEALEDEAYRRAFSGSEKPVFFAGKQCGKVREYSDTLLIFLLKAANPAKYRDNFKQPEAAQGRTVEQMLEEIARERGLSDDDAN